MNDALDPVFPWRLARIHREVDGSYLLALERVVESVEMPLAGSSILGRGRR